MGAARFAFAGATATPMASTTRNVQDGYFLSSDVNLQIKLQVINLNGACPALVANEPVHDVHGGCLVWWHRCVAF